MLSRAQFLRMMAGTTGAALAACRLPRTVATPAIARQRRPNVLLLLTDQERSWQDLPTGLSLPRRHEIAARGVNFTQYHVAAMACAPSRSAIYTGQHIQRTGVFDNPGKAPGRKELDPAATPTIGAMMREAGYRTAYIGKWHLSTIEPAAGSSLGGALRAFGFDEYVPALADGDTLDAAREGLERDAPIAAGVVRWLKANADLKHDRPWFLAVNLINPHDIQYLDATGHQSEHVHPRFARTSPVPDRDPYRDDLHFDLPTSFPGTRPRLIAAHRAYEDDAKVFYGDLPLENIAAWRKFQNYYFNCLRDVDRQIGAIVDALDASAAAGGTMMVFSSDHGEMGGAQGLRLKGPFIYKENFRVPLVIVHPDLRGGAASTASLASGIDLAPTLLAAAGVTDAQRAERYPALKGCNLLNVAASSLARVRKALLFNCSIVHCCNPIKKLEMVVDLYSQKPGEKPAPRRFPGDFVQVEDRSFLRAVFDGRYKLGRYFAPAQHHRPATWDMLSRYNDLELYDTLTDPGEMRNLAGDPARRELVLRLNGELNALLDGEAGGDDGSYMPGDPALWRLG